MRFLDKGDGEEFMSESILDVGVEKALEKIKYDQEEFIKRDGNYLFDNQIITECNKVNKFLEF